MSWIKDNKFPVALGGATLVAAVLLVVAASKGSSRYAAAREEFDAAAAEASTFERLALYPRAENRDGKQKALDEYKASLEALQAAFEPFRPKEIANISPQDFTDRLKAANDGLLKGFGDAGVVLPDGFFSGFESYRTSLASGNATGILDYQLAGINRILEQLTASGATELRNLHRPPLTEEEGGTFKPAPGDVARTLPLEITFTGPENAVRGFLSAITKPDPQYIVIRSLRISNVKQDPPRAADAKFDSTAGAGAFATSGADAAAGGFVFPDEESPAAGRDTAAPAPKPADSTRILAQVLGGEQLQVFLRLDLLQFLPAAKLP
jgi:hypothetical protein